MSRILVIDGHPDSKSLTHDLSAAYQAGAGQHLEVARLELRELRFDPILRRGYAEPQPLEPDLQRAQAAILAAQHVAWFFPCWWNAPPALVKGFLDRVLLPGFAFRYGDSALPEKLLAGRSARFVTSMDSPWIWHVLVNRSALHVQFERSTLKFCGFSPVRSNTFYSARKMSAQDRERATEKMRKVGAEDALRALATPRSSAAVSAAAA
jgi:NAD(P)H dehydrogenase (quinone)